jgi:hypothetical protein
MINVTQGIEKQKAKSFPKLMNNGSTIVLFYQPKVGTIIKNKYESEIFIIGKSCCEWNMDEFEDYNGKLILQNGDE